MIALAVPADVHDSLKAMASEMTNSLTKGILGFMDPNAGGAGASYDH